jgi:hypothetical protein
MKNNNMINKGVYYVFCDCRYNVFDEERVEVEYSDERELVKKLLMVKCESEEEVVESYFINKGDMSFDDVVDDVIENKDEYGYLLNEELCGVSEFWFNKLYKEEYNKVG